MTRTVRALTRSIMALVTVLTLAATLAQPAPMLRAQEDAPPTPSSPTASVADQSRSSEPYVRVKNSDGTMGDDEPEPSIPPPDSTPENVAAEPQVQAAPATSPDNAAAAPQLLVAPQAGTPITPFLVNVVSKSTAQSGTDLTYTIFFTNTGSTTYQNVLLQNNLGIDEYFLNCLGDNLSTCPYTYSGDLYTDPNQKPTLLSVIPGGQYDVNRELIWSLGTVAPGKKGRISYTLRISHENFPRTGQPARLLGNTVALYKDGAINTVNKLNEDQWAVLMVGPVFYTTKTASQAQVLQGDEILYEITVGNATGPNDKPNGKLRSDARTATKIKVIDKLPFKLDPATIVFQSSPAGTYNPADGWITWDLGNATLTPDSSIKLSFKAKVRSDNDLTECFNVVNEEVYATSDELPHPFNSSDVRYIRGEIPAVSFIFPPVGLTVGHNPGSIYVQETATWSIVVSNFWKTAISGAEVQWYVPENFTYISSNPPATQYDAVNRKVIWSNLNLPIKASFATPGQIQLNVTGRAGRSIDGAKNKSYTLVNVPPSVPNGCLRGVEDGIAVEPLLSAFKTVDATTWKLAGTTVVYTVDLYNKGSQPMNDVSLEDWLPWPHLFPFTFQSMVNGGGPPPVSISPASPAYGQQQKVRWEGLTIPGGTISSPGKTTLRFIVKVDGLPRDCADNIIFPDSSISEARSFGGATVCIDYPMYIEKTANRSVINPRDTNRLVEFTLKYTNRTSTSYTVTPKDDFRSMPGVVFKRMLTGPDGIIKPDPNQINNLLTWPTIALGGNQTVYYKFEAELPAIDGVIPSGGYCNWGILKPEDLPWVAEEEACVFVSSIRMLFRKEIYGRDIIGLGEVVTYKLVLENQSSDTVRELVISDTLPINMTYIEPLAGSPAPNVTNQPNGQQLLRWEGLDVRPNTIREIYFKVRAPALIGNVLNKAEVTGGVPIPAFICDETTSTGCIANRFLDVRSLIAIGPEVTPSTTDPGTDVTYTLSVASTNNIPYENTTISDTLPLGFTFVKMISGPPPAQPQPGVLVWKGLKVPEVGAPEAGRITLIFQAKAAAAYGTFASRIEASSTTGVIPTAENTVPVLIAPEGPAVSIVAPPLANVGSEVKFKIMLVNPEATAVDNVTVNAQLPNGFTFNRPEQGTTMPIVNGQQLTWSGLTMPAASNGTFSVVELTFYATAPQTIGTYTATVTATGSQAIDQTFNTTEIIVAKLRYIYLALIAMS
jgi:uncharacterized repeat protein (TIGR01451 family)